MRTRLSQRLSTSSILLREPAIPEEGTLEESLAPLKEPAAPTQAPTDPTFALAEPSAEAGPEAAAEARTDQIGSGTEQGAGGQQEADELGEAGEEGSREVHHCPVCSISTTSAAHLEVTCRMTKLNEAGLLLIGFEILYCSMLWDHDKRQVSTIGMKLQSPSAHKQALALLFFLLTLDQK